MTPEQIKLVRFLLNTTGLTGLKEDIVYSFTDNRTEHLTQMTYDETKAIIKYLQGIAGPGFKTKDNMVGKILSMAHELHWELPNSSRVDMKRVNNWCIRFSGLNKPLDAFKYSELPALVSQFEMVYRDFLKGI